MEEQVNIPVLRFGFDGVTQVERTNVFLAMNVGGQRRGVLVNPDAVSAKAASSRNPRVDAICLN